MKRFAIYLIILSAFLYNPQSLFGQTENTFKTKYVTIYYAQDKDINDFIWRLGGGRSEFSGNTGLASNRVDRIVERVETILDMIPKNFKINIYLHRDALSANKIAYYDHKTRSVHIVVDYATDGIVAHEIAHAVINQYFASPPPSKIQEILTQYVDKYLWSDY